MQEIILVITLVLSDGQKVDEVVSKHQSFVSCHRALNKFDMKSNKNIVKIGCYKSSKD